MHLIDTHAHIYLPEFEKDRKIILENAMNAGINKILMPAIDSSTHQSMLKLESENDMCLSMIGLHPCSVNEDFEREVDVVEQFLFHKKFIAIGEIGLDFYWDKTFTQQQFDAFDKQIQLALKYNLPIVIHSRNATDECIEVVSKYKSIRGVFHCFSGNVVQAKKLIDLNFMLGIGGVVTFKNAGLDKVIEAIGIEHVILETDAPYLAPVPFRGKRNEPAYIKYVAEKIAMILNVTVEEVVTTTSQNAINLFSLS